MSMRQWLRSIWDRVIDGNEEFVRSVHLDEDNGDQVN